MNGSTKSVGREERWLNEKNAARVIMLCQATHQNVERYRHNRRQKNQLFREKKRRQEEEEFEELEQLNRSHEARKFYQKLNRCRTGFLPRAELYRDKNGSILTDDCEVTVKWKQNLVEHLNGVQEEDLNGEEDNVNGTAEDGDVPSPTIGEVKDAIKRLNNIKSAGKEGIGVELIKLADCLHQLIVKIWDTEQIPEKWKDGVFCSIYKEGDKLDCENYLALTVLNATYKVLSQVIFQRLSPLAKRLSREADTTDQGYDRWKPVQYEDIGWIIRFIRILQGTSARRRSLVSAVQHCARRCYAKSHV